MKKQDGHSRILPPMWIFTLLLAALLIWLAIELKELVALLVIGYSIAYLIDPALDWLESKKISRSAGVFAVSGGLLVVLVVLGLTALPTLVREYGELSQNLPEHITTAKEKIVPMLERAWAFVPHKFSTEDPKKLLDALPGVGPESFKNLLGVVGSTLMQGYSATLTIINLLLLPFFVYYIAVNFNGAQRRVLSVLPYHLRPPAERIMKSIDGSVSAYVRGQLIVCTILFVLFAAALGLIGVELWLVLAIITGFGNIIPYLGSLIGIVLCSLMTLVTFGDFTHLLMVWIAFAVIQFLEGNFITPNIVGERVGLPPLVVVIAIMAGGTLFGLLGIFLAVPGAAVLQVLLREGRDWLLDRSRKIPVA